MFGWGRKRPYTTADYRRDVAKAKNYNMWSKTMAGKIDMGFLPPPKKPYSLANPRPVKGGGTVLRAPAVITRQHDYQPAVGRKKLPRRVARRRYRRLRRWKRKVQRGLNKPYYTLCLYQNISRSWKNTPNKQAVVAIPVLGYRGPSVTTASTALGAAGSNNYVFRADQVTNVVNKYCLNTIFYGQSGATNLAQVYWWLKHMRSSLDITITNTGSNNLDDGTARNVEYDVYACWANRNLKFADYSQSYPLDWDNSCNRYEQNRQGVTGIINESGIDDANWTPYSNPIIKKIGISSKKLFSGYIDVGETVRMRRVYKSKKLFSLTQFEGEDGAGAPVAYTAATHALMPGAGMMLVVCFRGIVVPGSGNGQYATGRLAFTCNWKHYFKLDGKNQAGTGDDLLSNDDYQ